ncbi:restriction endonuclease [bacterium]|nr:restriction endonuclease [bacterium]
MPRSTPHTSYDVISTREYRWAADSPYSKDWLDEWGETPRQFLWRVNGQIATQAENIVFDEYYAGSSPRGPFRMAPLAFCSFCESPMEKAEFAEPNDIPYRGGSFKREYYLVNCDFCYHWAFGARENSNRYSAAPVLVEANSVARKFGTHFPEGCAAELAQQLRLDPSLWHTIAPRDMERFVADIFRANYRHADVVHVGKSGDLGVDVLFVDAGGNDWLIQVKRRGSPTAVEGFDTLQRLLGTLTLKGKLRGIIVTTGHHFSQPLICQASQAEQRGFRIELIDRGKLDRMLTPVLPVRPWLKLLDSGLLPSLDAEVREHFISNISDPRQLRLFYRL